MEKNKKHEKSCHVGEEEEEGRRRGRYKILPPQFSLFFTRVMVILTRTALTRPAGGGFRNITRRIERLGHVSGLPSARARISFRVLHNPLTVRTDIPRPKRYPLPFPLLPLPVLLSLAREPDDPHTSNYEFPRDFRNPRISAARNR